MALPKHTTRKGAAKGEPSFIWIGKSGRQYRTVVHAKIDNPANAIDKPNTATTTTATATTPETNNVFFWIIIALVILIFIKIMK